MNEPVWLTGHQMRLVHGEQLAVFGGPPGLRDAGLLSSALDRARNKFAYGETRLPALAAACAFGLAKNHPFADGNKRIAFAAMMMFLRRPGVAFAPPPGRSDRQLFWRWPPENFPRTVWRPGSRIGCHIRPGSLDRRGLVGL